MSKKTAIIIGAGPAGLTAAYELLERTKIQPIIFEETDYIGGISRTAKHKGNRMDIGGHRFFSKSDRVMNWWRNILPLQGKPSKDDIILKREVKLSNEKGSPDPEKNDEVMLVRHRLSRIFFLRKFFSYPVSLSLNTFRNLGLVRVVKILISYVQIRLFPIKKEKSLEDFFTNRFGRELYLTFFKDYTEKLWGVKCGRIKPEWGAQRIKGVSISAVVVHALKSIFKIGKSKKVETSLIDQFYYPKYGPGQLWEEVAEKIKARGGKIYLNRRVAGVKSKKGEITGVEIADSRGKKELQKADYYFSSMPVKDLISVFDKASPEVRRVAGGLVYRDFITVGLLLDKLLISNETEFKTINNIVPDTWMYIQERDVKIGRIQIFNNWSPYLVSDLDKVWIGLEYFCNEGDELWRMEDKKFINFAISELEKIDILKRDDVLDSTIIRMKKTYPAYFGTYDKFSTIRQFVDGFSNLFLVGRNGMHRYNNMDHSMMTAMTAVDNIIAGVASKDNIWSVNTEEEYHESKDSSESASLAEKEKGLRGI